MTRSRVLPLGSAESAVASHRDAGGVLEFVLVEPVGESEAERHADAATVALAEITDRWERRVEASIATTGQPRSRYPTIVTHPERAVGRRIDVTTFVGRAYDWTTRRIVSMWSDTSPGERSGLHSCALEGRSKEGAGEFLTDGYAEVFSDTPYGIRANLDQLNAWFEAINRELIGGLDEDLVVWNWSTDWSTWFDDGRDWWGAYLWTVEREGRPWITAIGASSTD